MSINDRRVPLAVLLFLLLACAGLGPAEPTDTADDAPRLPFAPRPPAPPPPPPTPLGSLDSARVFDFAGKLTYKVSWYTETSRFILFHNGTFALQLSGPEYRGRYTEANGDVVFAWDGWSGAGPWGAEGRLVGDRLEVRYNTIMLMTDFEDAIYMRSR